MVADHDLSLKTWMSYLCRQSITLPATDNIILEEGLCLQLPAAVMENALSAASKGSTGHVPANRGVAVMLKKLSRRFLPGCRRRLRKNLLLSMKTFLVRA